MRSEMALDFTFKVRVKRGKSERELRAEIERAFLEGLIEIDPVQDALIYRHDGNFRIANIVGERIGRQRKSP